MLPVCEGPETASSPGVDTTVSAVVAAKERHEKTLKVIAHSMAHRRSDQSTAGRFFRARNLSPSGRKWRDRAIA